MYFQLHQSKNILLVVVFLLLFSSCTGEGAKINKHNDIGHAIDSSSIVGSSSKSSIDTLKLIHTAKVFFNEHYIGKRILEIDPSGIAQLTQTQFLSGDINADNKPDVVVFYTLEGEGGGNNWRQYLLMLEFKNDSIVALNHTVVQGTLIGVSRLLGFRNGYIIFDMLDFNSDNFVDRIEEANPDKYVRRGFGIRGDQMVIEELAARSSE